MTGKSFISEKCLLPVIDDIQESREDNAFVTFSSVSSFR